MPESAARGTGGYPKFGLITSNIVSALVPDRLKLQPGSPQGEGRDPVEVDFKVQGEAWQEYKTIDGFLVRARPVVTKVFKHDEYNEFNEPVHSVGDMQTIQDVIRAAA